MDNIFIKNIKVYGYHGVLEEEKENGQNFFVDVRLFLDTHSIGVSDDIECAVDYSEVALYVNSFLSTSRYDLIEAAADNLAMNILKKYKKLEAVEIILHKPDAPIPLEFEDVSICIKRSYHEVYIALGSNMGDKQKYINDAISAIKTDNNFKDILVSSLITTKPYGGVEQDDFLNGALKVYTLYTPDELLKCLNKIEAASGRERKEHWGPRTLDLDILFYDDEVINTDDLTVPHVDMKNRLFVLEPLMELCPYKYNNMTRMSVCDMYNNLKEEVQGDNR